MQNKYGRRIVAGAALIMTFLGSQSAMAQGFDLQHFHPMPNPMGNYLGAASADVAPNLEWSAMIVGNYANNPLIRVYESERVERLVARQGTAHLLMSMGFFDLVEVGLDVPVLLLQKGSALPGTGVSPEDGGFGIGDIRLVPKVQIFSTVDDDDDLGFALALLVDAHIPTGKAEYLQGGDFRIGPRLAFDAHIAAVKVGANVGYLYRGSQSLEELEVRDTLSWQLAAEVPVWETLSITGELFGRLTPGAEKIRPQESPSELLLGGKYSFGNINVLAGGGAGLVSGYGTPDFRAFIGFGWMQGPEPDLGPIPGSEHLSAPASSVAPAEPEPEPEVEPECSVETVDEDCVDLPATSCVDGVLTTYSASCEEGQCAYVASETECAEGMECGEEEGEPACVVAVECVADEDCTDGPQPSCEDGVLTTYEGRCEEDACAYDPLETACDDGEECGLKGGVAACVEKTELVEVDEQAKRIEIKDIIHFDTESARVRSRSHALLNQVAQVLENNPQIKVVRIEGHSDSKGSREFNITLSERRANLVRAYLIERGIEPGRLKAIGYGPDRPVADNETEEGRAQNRRVEFHIEGQN